MGSYASKSVEADVTTLRSNLAEYLKRTDAARDYVGKTDYNSKVATLATITELQKYVLDTDLDTKLETYASSSLTDTQINNMVTSLAANNTFLNKVSTKLAEATTAITSAVAPLLIASDSFKNSVFDRLKQDDVMINHLANKVTEVDTYRQRLKGDPGSIGSESAFMGELKKYSLTCAADGTVCELPTSTKDRLIKLPQNYVMEFGAGVTGKEGNAGKIAYQKWTPDALDIVGGGSVDGERKVRLYDNVVIGKDGTLQLGKHPTRHDQNTIHANTGSVHLSTPDTVFLLGAKGAVVGNNWGGSGNLQVHGDLSVNGRVTGTPSFPDGIKIGRFKLWDQGSQLFIDEVGTRNRWALNGANPGTSGRDSKLVYNYWGDNLS